MPELTTRVLNFWSGPGGGKSTVKAGTFFQLKCIRAKSAQIEEYATERSFAEDWETLSNQRKVTWEQDARQRRLQGKVEWIVTDSPLPLGILYAQGEYATEEFNQEVWDLFDSYSNVNVFIDRVKPFETYGRHHTEAESRALEQRLRDMLGDRIDFTVPGDEQAPEKVLEFLKTNYMGV